MNKINLNSSKKVISYKDDKGKAKKVSRNTKQNINHSNSNDTNFKDQKQGNLGQCKSKMQQIDQSYRRTTKTRLERKNQHGLIEKQQIIQFVTKHPQDAIKTNKLQRSIINTQNENKKKKQNEKTRLPNQTILLQCPTDQTNHQKIHLQKQQIAQKDIQLSLLRVSNQQQLDKIKNLEKVILQKDQAISKMNQTVSLLMGQISNINSQNSDTYYSNVQYSNFRNDSKRLLKMLQNTQEYKQFANLALDDGAIRFLHSVNKNKKTQLDSSPSSHSQNPIHFCSCNKQFYRQSDLWVPQRAYSLANQFLKKRNGSLTSSQIQLILYELNRIWREREKRIINSTNSRQAHELSNYKRKIHQIKNASDQLAWSKLQ